MFTYFVSYAVPTMNAFGHTTVTRTHPVLTQDDVNQVHQGVRDAAGTPDVVLINVQLLSGPNG